LLLLLYIGNRFVHWMLFPYSVGLIKHEMGVSYNKKLCIELINLFGECGRILRINLGGESKPVVFFEYKSLGKSLSKMCEMVDTIGKVNNKIIEDNSHKPTKLFVKVT
jgi:hypothetical protein